MENIQLGPAKLEKHSARLKRHATRIGDQLRLAEFVIHSAEVGQPWLRSAKLGNAKRSAEIGLARKRVELSLEHSRFRSDELCDPLILVITPAEISLERLG